MLLISPNGVAVEAADNAVEGLLKAGFKPGQPQKVTERKPATRKRAARKTTKE